MQDPGLIDDLDDQFNFAEEEKLSQEDQALVELYGNKIMNVKWFFENDSAVQTIVKNKLNRGTGFGIFGG